MNSKIFTLIVLLLYVGLTNINGQDSLLVDRSKIDSLKTLIALNSKADKEKVRLLNEYARLCFYNQEYKEGLIATREARDLSKKMPFPECRFLSACRVANPTFRARAFSIIDENQACRNYNHSCRAIVLCHAHNSMSCSRESQLHTTAGIWRESQHSLSGVNVCVARCNPTHRLAPYRRAYDGARKFHRP